MSDLIRVRLEFNRFSRTDLRNCLLSVNKTQTKDIKGLKKLIQSRHHFQQNLLLLIDGFVLEDSETIDVIRDNDLVVIEPEVKMQVKVEVKKEPNVEEVAKPVTSGHSFTSQYFDDKKNVLKRSQKRKCTDSDSEVSEKSMTNESESVSTSVRTPRNRKPVQTPKPKKKRQPREATEPVDRFSPIIILDRQPIPSDSQSNRLTDTISKTISVSLDSKNKKQSARKSFPKPSQKTKSNANKEQNHENSKNSVNNTQNNGNVVINDDKTVSKKPIDFENCQPLTSIPIVGDIIAFKMMTTSTHGDGYECSPFRMGSVLSANQSTQMVDILLQDVLKRNNLNSLSKSEEQTLGIHSLKIDWSTVLEPKLIQKSSNDIDSQVVTLE